MLKRSGNSGCLYLVPHLIGKTFKLPSSLTSFDVSDGLIDGLYNVPGSGGWRGAGGR